MSQEGNVHTVQRLYEAFGAGDVQTILDHLAEDVEWKEPPNGVPPFAGTHHGREAVAEFFRQLAEATEVMRFAPKEFIADGDLVVALGSYEFRARPTGKSWDTDWAMVWRFRDGRVASFQVYKDSAAEVAAFTS